MYLWQYHVFEDLLIPHYVWVLLEVISNLKFKDPGLDVLGGQKSSYSVALHSHVCVHKLVKEDPSLPTNEVAAFKLDDPCAIIISRDDFRINPLDYWWHL